MLAPRSSNDPNADVERLAGRGGQTVAHRVLVGVEEATAGVADDDDLVGPEQLLADDEERMTSSVTSPPAFRMTWASPVRSPRAASTSSRASMQATTARPRNGVAVRTDRSNDSA